MEDKKILIIGGTYFLGKAFAELILGEENIELTLLHRRPVNGGIIGKAIENDPSRVREFLADRHDKGRLGMLKDEHFDAIVDFCAYQKGDIKDLLENIGAGTDQYIFISTSDVYKRGTGLLQNEDSDLEDRNFGGEAGEYISGKVSLEREIAQACSAKGCHYTVLRPVFIFGPDNYAPRESIYFQWIEKAGQIIHPSDADGEFQMVYVKDVAKTIRLVIGNEKAYDKAFNVCENRMQSYAGFAELLKKAAEKEFVPVEVDIQTVNEKGIPLPFPLTKEESNYYDGSRIKELGMVFTSEEEAMRETYTAYLTSQSV